MPAITAYLLGPPRILSDGDDVRISRRKVIALFAYLSVQGTRKSRAALTSLIYPEHDTTHALANFRQILFSLRTAVGDECVMVDQQSVAISDDGHVWVDVREFRNLRSHGIGLRGSNPERAIASLVGAARLYRGDFLSGFSVRDSIAFEEWHSEERGALRREYEDLLAQLISLLRGRGRMSAAIDYARQLLSLDDLDETRHRLLMELYHANGQSSAAAEQFKMCREILDRELSEVPDERTEALYRRVRASPSRHEALAPRQKERPSRPHSLTGRPGTVVAVLLGDPNDSAGRGAGTLPTGIDLISESAQIAERNGGCVFDLDGADVAALFSNSREAVLAAIDMRATIRRMRLDSVESVTATERVAVTDGALVDIDGDLHGPAIERALYLLSELPPGQCMCSAVAAQAAHSVIPDGVTFHSVGTHRLHDLAPAAEFFQIVHSEFQEKPGSLITIDAFPNNLPTQLTSLVGRRGVIRSIVEMVAARDCRLVTLTGPGGTGKTRLALHSAAQLTVRFADGVFLVTLSSATSDRDVLPYIARAIGVREPVGQRRSLKDHLCDYLGPKQMLLIVDNFEHVISGAAHVADLLEVAGHLQVIVTSREPLHISGETVVTVQPLGTPAGNANGQERYRCESVQLFEDRARESVSGFELTPENSQVVAEICDRLDGLPLAIELAASRMRVLSAEDVLRRLSDRLGLLRGGNRDLPDRQQTLRNTIDWSYDLLVPAEKRLFGALSVFAGGCDLETAERVCGHLYEESGDVLDGLASLADKSLLRSTRNGGQTRFWMIEIIHEYARAQAAADPELPRTREEHAAYYLELAERAAPMLECSEQVQWFSRLTDEHGNIQAALRHFLDGHHFVEAQRAAGALRWYWHRSGRTSEGVEWLTMALGNGEHPDHIGARARALNALGWLVYVQSQWLSACKLHRESLDLFRQVGDDRSVVTALADLGVAERWMNLHEEGRQHNREAVELARQLGDPDLLSRSLLWAHGTTGGKFEGDPPIKELEEAVSLSKKSGNCFITASSLNGLGDLYRELGNNREAKAHYQEALRQFRQLDERWMIAWTLEGLGRVHANEGNAYVAREQLAESIACFALTGDVRDAVSTVATLATIMSSDGSFADAAVLFAAVNSIRRSLDESAEEPAAHENKIVEPVSGLKASHPDEWVRGSCMTLDEVVAFLQSG